MPIITQKLIPQYSSVSELQKFSSVVLNKRKLISAESFADEFGRVRQMYFKDKQRDLFCSEADLFAEQLIKSKNYDFASIIISSLCKITEFIPDKLELFALRGYEIAKHKGDFVHMMSRLNNLRKVYQGNPDRLYDYVKVLYKQEKCLKELTNHYESAIGSYQSLIRKPASKKEYETMLAYIQTEIAKLTRRKHPEDALAKLKNAKAIFEKQQNKQSLRYVNFLISKINNNIV